MARRTNNFDSGTNGATISSANSGGGSQTAFQLVSIGAGATLTYDNTQASSGSLSAKITPASAQNAYLQYGGSTGNLMSEDTALDFKMYRTAHPNSEFSLMTAYETSGGRRSQLNLQADGRLKMRTEGATWLWTSSAPLPLNAWIKIRFFTRNQGTGVSLTKVAIYNGATLIEEFSTNSSDRTAAIAGIGVGKTGTDASAQVFWIDDFIVETDASGYIDDELLSVVGAVSTRTTIDVSDSTGDITEWGIAQISGPAASAVQLSTGIWSVPIPADQTAVWRVTLTASNDQTATADYTVNPVDVPVGGNAPVVMMYREDGDWV